MPDMIEKLKALDDIHIEEQWTTKQEDALLELKAELIALWEAVAALGNNSCSDHVGNIHLRARVWEALEDLDAKAEEVLK